MANDPTISNNGVWVEGSAKFTAGVVAAGANAKAIGRMQYSETIGDMRELQAALASLIIDLRSAPAGSDDPGSLAEIAISAHREMQKQKPNKRKIRDLLQILMAGATNSAALANALVTIQHAVSVLL